MKIYLASFFQPENHGHGRKISIATGLPPGIEVDGKYDHLIPAGMSDYYRDRYKNPKEAGDTFVSSYINQLDDLYNELKKDAELENKSMTELFDLQDGDTLLSWEKAGNMSYRSMVAEFLIKLGFEVNLR